MRDSYPKLATLPQSRLAETAMQPDYEDVHCPEVTGSSNIGDLIADAHVRAGHGDAIAVIHAETGRSLTFAELAERSTRLAHALVAFGLAQGERVAYKASNVPDVLVVMLAIWKAGGVVLPLPVNARAGELAHFLEDGAPRYLFVNGAAGFSDELSRVVADAGVERVFAFDDDSKGLDVPHARELEASGGDRPLPVISADQVAIIWHTGGTTGRPKACYHTHRRFLLGGYMFAKGAGTAPGQRWAAAAPTGHALGIIYNTIFTLLHGATAVLIEGFHDAGVVLRAIARHRITTLTALTATWANMADAVRADDSYDLASLSRCYAMWQSASSASVFFFWRQRGVELLNNFGSTSFATWVLIPDIAGQSPRASLGKALPGYRVQAVTVEDRTVRILPRGEIGRMAVRGPTGLTYWNLPELQERDVVQGWTLCDDLIRFDETGNVHYMGRSDYMISTAGFKVAPVEVEQILARHPAVREVAVVPAPDAIRQEIVTAFVSLTAGAIGDSVLEMQLQDLVARELSSYKAPRHIYFIDGLPRDALGKVQTKIVRQWAVERSSE